MALNSSSLTPANRGLLTGRGFFPGLISGPFHDGLVLVFAVSAALGLVAAVVSLMRGTSKPPAGTAAAVTPAAASPAVPGWTEPTRSASGRTP